MSNAQWAAQRGRPGVPVVPRSRIPAPPTPASAVVRHVSAPDLPPIEVSPFGLSFTYGRNIPKITPKKLRLSEARALPPVVVSAPGFEAACAKLLRAPSIMGIIREVAAEHGLDEQDLVGERRSKSIVIARHHAMWRCDRERRWSLGRIGKAFSKDHTTVLNGIRRHEQRMREAGNA